MPSSSSGSAQPAQRSTQKAPVCPVERECGACQHVGVPYAQQLASKDTRVAELFADVADASALRPILGMDEPYYYRNKVVSPYAPGRKLQGSANARAGKGRDARGGRDGKRAQKPRRASFQQAVVDVQVKKAEMALEQTGARTFCLGGGVAANPALRDAYEQLCERLHVRLTLPPLSACGDNAGMIALVALDRHNQGKFFTLEADAQAHANLDEPY